MKPFNNEIFMQQIKELTDMIDKYEFQDMEAAYLEQLEKLNADLFDTDIRSFSGYVTYFDSHITDLKCQIIERFSMHNKHLTEEYLHQLIETDCILSAQLNHTTKSDDCRQYLLAKERYALKYREIFSSIPAICALPTDSQDKLLSMAMHVAELNFLLNLHWTIKA